MSILTDFTYTPHNLSIEEEKRQLIITHRVYLKGHANTVFVEVVPEELETHQYNLYAYLNKVGIDRKLHWVILIINDFKSPECFKKGISGLFIPDITVVEDILAMHG